jgi:hypothetical protein
LISGRWLLAATATTTTDAYVGAIEIEFLGEESVPSPSKDALVTSNIAWERGFVIKDAVGVSAVRELFDRREGRSIVFRQLQGARSLMGGANLPTNGDRLAG